ncbi:MAG TPA: osmotically inducible protein OsmC [Planctomycetes bacterium]|nr:osmotically inducible protein OsmC [Planctomycetota bacterium]
MTVEITITYEGDLRCKSVHGPSDSEVATDAPVDNQGKGESFSPTDMVATAWGSCMLTIMGIVANRHGIDLVGSKVIVQKYMATNPVRRIGKLEASIEIPTPLSWGNRQRLQRAAENCPVHHSLADDIEKVVHWQWTELENEA